MTRMVPTHLARAASSPSAQAASPSAAGMAPVPPQGAADQPLGSSGHSTFAQHDVLPASAGISLKPSHYATILSDGADTDYFEVHAENYFGRGGAPHRYLTAIRERHALSIHGIGLSLGGAEALDVDHLARLQGLIDRYEPALVSEHLAWCASGGAYFNDLLPVALTNEALTTVCRHVSQTQDVLGRQILVENPANYLAFEVSDIPETEFLSEMAARTGCGLLLDINNVVVSAHNLKFDAGSYLNAFPMVLVREVHLAGHADDRRGAAHLKIDDHGSAPGSEVWDLYRSVIAQNGPVPTTIEWDRDVPPLADLEREAQTARSILQGAEGAVEAAGRGA